MNAIEKVSPDAKNYMRGGTRLFVRRTADPAGAMLHIGNIVGAPMSRNQQAAEHITGMSGSRVIDRRRVEVMALIYTVRTDESTFENYRLWMMGGAATDFVQYAASGISQTIAAITACATEADIVVGRYYPLSKKAVTGFSIPGLTLFDTDADTGDYKLDAEFGKVAFCRALTAPEFAASASFGCSALRGKQFNPHASTEIPVVAEGLRSMEEGDVQELWTVPKARIEPSGDADVTTENDRTLEFVLTQLKHSTDDWGTVTRWVQSGT